MGEILDFEDLDLAKPKYCPGDSIFYNKNKNKLKSLFQTESGIITNILKYFHGGVVKFYYFINSNCGDQIICESNILSGYNSKNILIEINDPINPRLNKY